MRKAAWSILVMGLSLAAVIICYVWFGHIGPKNAAETLEKQQEDLRAKYGLPPKPVITNDSILLIPPSLRNFSGAK